MNIFNQKTKRLMSAVIAFMLVITTFTALPNGVGAVTATAAETGSSADYFSYVELDDGTIEITSYNADEADVVIPSAIDGKTVTSLGEYCFEYAELETVKFPDTLKKIKENAFYCCSNLVNLEIPESIEEIGANAFYACSSIGSIDFPNKAVKMGSNAFGTGSWYWNRPNGPIIFGKNFYNLKYYDQNLRTYDIPDGIVNISEGAFNGAWLLEEITIPDSVKYIGARAFENTAITEIKIPKSITAIEDYTFYSCRYLESIELHEGITYIGDYAFYGCENIKKFELPESLTHIGSYAFGDCYSADIAFPENNKITYVYADSFKNTSWYNSLPYGEVYVDGMFLGFKNINYTGDYQIADGTKVIGGAALSYFEGNVTVPDGVEYICDRAFSNNSFSEIELPESLKEIGDGAFSSCNSLRKIDLPDSVAKIGENAFSYCSNLNEIKLPGALKKIEQGCFEQCKALTEITIPDSVTEIECGAFERSGLTELNLGKNIKNLEYGITNLCDSLEAVTVDTDNPYLYTEDGVLYTKNKSEILFYPPSKSDETFVIPGTVKTLGIKDGYGQASVFANNQYIKNLVFAEGVQNIEDHALSDCYSLETITIPSTMKKIEGNAFAWDSDIQTINYNAVDCKINNAFSGLKQLRSVNFGDDVKSIDNNAFYYNSLSSVTLPKNVEYIGWSAFSTGSPWYRSFMASQEDGVVYIGKTAYTYKGDDNGPANLVIKQGTKGISGSAFEGLYIETVSFPDTLISIGSEAFRDCRSLSSINIPSSVIKIDDSAFSGCYNLSSLKLNEGLKEIGDNAFYDCNSLTEVIFPQSLEKIGDEAFSLCTAIENITFSENLIKIGRRAFYENDSLKEITIPSKITCIRAETFADCDNLEKVSLSSSVNFIYERVFSHCEKLTEINNLKNVKSIGGGAFEYCSSLTKAELGEKLRSVNNYTFAYCSSLSDINIPKNVQYIGDAAFISCVSLSKISIPESVDFIGKCAFYGCEGLKTVRLYEGLRSIDSDAFSGCNNRRFNCIRIPKSVKSLSYYIFTRPGLMIMGYAGSAAEQHVEETSSPIWFLDITGITFGDVDGNGVVNIIDASLIQKALAEITELSDEQWIAADANCDGSVDILDSVFIAKCLAGYEEFY